MESVNFGCIRLFGQPLGMCEVLLRLLLHIVRTEYGEL